MSVFLLHTCLFFLLQWTKKGRQMPCLSLRFITLFDSLRVSGVLEISWVVKLLNQFTVTIIFPLRLKDYPHYCQHLASIPHFMEFPPSLIEYIEYGHQSREPLLGGRNIQVHTFLKLFYLQRKRKSTGWKICYPFNSFDSILLKTLLPWQHVVHK